MTTTAAATVFTLFLVTYGADVKHSTYDSLRACQEARSLAVTGMTIEAKKAADDAEVRRQRETEIKEQADLLRKYPPHEATVAELAEAKKNSGHLWSLDRCNEISFEVKSGFVMPVPPNCRATLSGGYSVAMTGVGSEGIKTAECVIVPPNEKGRRIMLEEDDITWRDALPGGLIIAAVLAVMLAIGVLAWKIPALGSYHTRGENTTCDSPNALEFKA